MARREELRLSKFNENYKGNAHWNKQVYLCEMSSFLTKFRIIKIVVFDFIIERRSCSFTRILAVSRTCVKIFSLIASLIVVFEFVIFCEIICPRLCVICQCCGPRDVRSLSNTTIKFSSIKTIDMQSHRVKPACYDSATRTELVVSAWQPCDFVSQKNPYENR